MGEGAVDQRSPEEIRRDIDATRSELSGTIEQIEDRLSPARIADRSQERMRSRWQSARNAVMGAPEQGRQQVSEQADRAEQRLERTYQGNPLAAGLIAFGAGALAASLLPSSKTERSLAAEVREAAEPAQRQVQQAARDVGQQLGEEAKQAAQHTAETAKDAARATAEEAKGAARTTGEEARGAAQTTGEQARDAARATGEEARDAAQQAKAQTGQQGGGGASPTADRGSAAGPATAERRRAAEQPTAGFDAEDTTKDELYERAQELDVPGRSQMTKEELADAIARQEHGPTKEELYERAQELDVPGRSHMTKEELAEAVDRAQR